MNIRIVTDSTCDLPAKTVDKHQIAVIPLHINQGDKSFLDGIELTREEFYSRLPDYKPAPSTSTPSPEAFRQKFEQLAEEGAQSILSIHISESLSATINSARMAAEQFKTIPVTVLDSSQLSLGLGFIVEKAAELAELGHKAEEILESLHELMKHTYVFASLKTLEYLRRSGRMHFALARFGEFLQIKPLLHMNQGKPTAHRARTQSRATERLMEWLKEYAPYETSGNCPCRRAGRSGSDARTYQRISSRRRNPDRSDHACTRLPSWDWGARFRRDFSKGH